MAVKPSFLDDQSDPEESRFLWSYQVTIENKGAETVQLLSRHWHITDAAGHIQEVRGPGVVGAQPVLEPGESFEYTSGCPLPTAVGRDERALRHARMQSGDGSFEVGNPAVPARKPARAPPDPLNEMPTTACRVDPDAGTWRVNRRAVASFARFSMSQPPKMTTNYTKQSATVFGAAPVARRCRARGAHPAALGGRRSDTRRPARYAERVARAFEDWFSGYNVDPEEFLSRTFAEVEGYDDMMVLRDIRFESHCEHHLAPIIGRAHVGYLPDRQGGRHLQARALSRPAAAHAGAREDECANRPLHRHRKRQPRGVAVVGSKRRTSA